MASTVRTGRALLGVACGAKEVGIGWCSAVGASLCPQDNDTGLIVGDGPRASKAGFEDVGNDKWRTYPVA